MRYVGTSGFSYKEWKGVFYPEKLSPKGYLSFYGEKLTTTEINNSFYRIPSAKVVAQWAEQVPDDFRFAMKMNQRVTHRKRLVDVDEEMGWFLEACAPLESKLGCVLVQLPPWFRCNNEVLDTFLGSFAKNLRMALEFRHDSWDNDETCDVLRKHEASLCVVETDKKPAIREITAPFLYVRLRRTSYTAEQVDEWVDWLKAVDIESDAFIYFKHESAAPVLALDLQDRLS